METETLELEGTWEEILKRSDELTGRHVRLTVLPRSGEADSPASLSPENRRMLEVLKAWEQTPLTEEEVKILEEFEQFRKDHSIRLRLLDDPT